MNIKQRYCDKFVSRIFGYVECTLDDRMQKIVLYHLQSCFRCRQVEQAIRRANRLIRSEFVEFEDDHVQEIGDQQNQTNMALKLWRRLSNTNKKRKILRTLRLNRDGAEWRIPWNGDLPPYNVELSLYMLHSGDCQSEAVLLVDNEDGQYAWSPPPESTTGWVVFEDGDSARFQIVWKGSYFAIQIPELPIGMFPLKLRLWRRKKTEMGANCWRLHRPKTKKTTTVPKKNIRITGTRVIDVRSAPKDDLSCIVRLQGNVDSSDDGITQPKINREISNDNSEHSCPLDH